MVISRYQHFISDTLMVISEDQHFISDIKSEYQHFRLHLTRTFYISEDQHFISEL